MSLKTFSCRAFPLVALRLFGDASFQPKQGKSRPRSLHIQANLKNPGSPSQVRIQIVFSSTFPPSSSVLVQGRSALLKREY
eukprot:scaffold35966_cov17-Tisochrysis_lutea.AAC.1